MRPLPYREKLIELMNNAPLDIAILAHTVLIDNDLQRAESSETDTLKNLFTLDDEHTRGDIIYFRDYSFPRRSGYSALLKIEADSIEVCHLKIDDSGVSLDVPGRMTLGRDNLSHIYVTPLKFDALNEDG